LERDFLDGVAGDVQLVCISSTGGGGQLGGVVPEGVVDVVDSLKVGATDHDVPRSRRALRYLLLGSGNGSRKSRIEIELPSKTSFMTTIPKSWTVKQNSTCLNGQAFCKFITGNVLFDT